MVEVFLVRPADGNLCLPQDAADRFAEVKRRTLGYIEASIRSPAASGTVRIDSAGLGATETEPDANQLLQALSAEFSSIRFVVERRRFPAATDAVWHRIDA